MESLTTENWSIVTGCERLTPGCDSCPSYWEYLAAGKNYNPIFNQEEINAPLDNHTPTRYTVALGSDLFHESVTRESLESVFNVMNKARWHLFEVVTKRAERMFCVTQGFEWGKNISLAVAIENKNYKWRLDYLRQTGAKTKAVSMVPLLGPMGELDLSGIDLVGVQAETWGLKREMAQEWADDIKRQCLEQSVFFVSGSTDIYSDKGVLCQGPE